MAKLKMQLPLTCEKHIHEGYGRSSAVPCPWCEIERLRAALLECRGMVGHPDNIALIDAALGGAVEPTACPKCLIPHYPNCEQQMPVEKQL